MDKLFERYRERIKGPVYPPYHKGLYFEEYFHKHFNIDLMGDRLYIPVFWTAAYINKQQGLQELLKKLDKNKKYFAVSQHDDAIREELPPDTLHFNAGGNKISEHNIAIPLLCSQLNYQHSERVRDIKASFIGSLTHPIRRELENINNKEYFIQLRKWNRVVESSLFSTYVDISLRSQFMLCPRGYGPTSYRLYESFQLGCVPVVITDKIYLPFMEEINWKDIAVIVMTNEIEHLIDKINGIKKDQYEFMKSMGRKIYDEYFTFDKVVYNIIKRLL